MVKYCSICNKELNYSTKGVICRDCIERGANMPTCLNVSCNNKLKRKGRKYCSRQCMMEHKALLRGGNKINKPTIVSRPKMNFCDKHQCEYKRGETCIKCDLEKQQDDYNKKVRNGWKPCAVCGKLIVKGRTKCRECIAKSFQERKEKGKLQTNVVPKIFR